MGERKREGQERWLYACFLAGLCHEIGKVGDVHVTSDTGLVWSPYSGSLMDWAEKNRIKKYYVDWEPGRHRQHELQGSVIFDRVLRDDDRNFIHEIDRNVLKQTLQALTMPLGLGSDRQSTGPYNVGSMLKQADGRSVQEDRKRSRTPADLGLEKPTPLIRRYHDGMRQLFREGKWKINRPGGAAWVLGPARDLFLVWDRCGRELYEFLLEQGVEGVPGDPEIIAEKLAGNRLIVASADGGIYWRIKLAGMDGVPLMVVRIDPVWAPTLESLKKRTFEKVSEVIFRLAEAEQTRLRPEIKLRKGSAVFSIEWVRRMASGLEREIPREGKYSIRRSRLLAHCRGWGEQDQEFIWGKEMEFVRVRRQADLLGQAAGKAGPGANALKHLPEYMIVSS